MQVNSLEDTPDANPADGVVADSMGRRTLRAALMESPARPRRITFGVNGGILLTSALPEAPNGTQLLGGGQVTLDSTAGGEGLQIGSSSSVSGIGFRGGGVYLGGSGNAVKGVTVEGAENGVHVAGDGNVVGGSTAADRNVLIGNRVGILVTGAGNRIQGNYVGVDATGATAFPNGVGIQVDALENPGGSNEIGGDVAGEGNVVSGNESGGILLRGLGLLSSVGEDQVVGNLVGTDAAGTAALGNGGAGIALSGLAGTRIEGNTVSGNAIGIWLQGGGSTVNVQRTVISGNRIGTDVTGVLPLPNDGPGIRLNDGAFSNTIGVSLRGRLEPNLIAYNRGDGILLRGSRGPFTPTGNTIRQNTIHDNGGLGIRMTNGRMQGGVRAPRLGRVTRRRAGGTAAPGTLVDVYVAARDISGAGEGRTYLASGRVDGNGRFSIALAGVPRRAWITATTTDGRGNTSVFARNRRTR